MVTYSIASARLSDSSENRVIMNGVSGYIGAAAFLKYMEDGYIRITGDNPEEGRAWKLLSQFTLEPGEYTFTGMKEGEQKIALQLHISDDTGFYQYFYQWNEDVRVPVEREAKATLHVMVYPNAEQIDVVARPAVYRDE